jgi:hypothetical protein
MTAPFHAKYLPEPILPSPRLRGEALRGYPGVSGRGIGPNLPAATQSTKASHSAEPRIRANDTLNS